MRFHGERHNPKHSYATRNSPPTLDYPSLIFLLPSPNPDHNFFMPQPIHNASIYFMRMITHDWADSFCHTILSHLRAAAGPQSKLVIVDAIVQHTCEDTTVAKDIPGGVVEDEEMKAPAPLLPNWGHAALFRYLCDIQVRGRLFFLCVF